MQILDHKLVVDGATIDLPKLAVPAIVHAWSVPTAYRDNGYFVSVQPAGQPMEIPACDGRDTQYLGQIKLEADAAALVAQAKDDKIAAATAACDAVLAPLGVEYGRWETATWDQQYAEATALMADPAASVPLISALAQARGMDVAVLAQRIIRNRETWSVLTGNVIGQRLAIVDRINAATTVEEVMAVDISISLPG